MISTHAEKAAELFKAGYNCSQSVAAAFCDVTKTDEKTMLATAAPFGGGFGRNREVCGAISGGCLVLGLLYGYTDPSDKTAKSSRSVSYVTRAVIMLWYVTLWRVFRCVSARSSVASFSAERRREESPQSATLRFTKAVRVSNWYSPQRKSSTK